MENKKTMNMKFRRRFRKFIRHMKYPNFSWEIFHMEDFAFDKFFAPDTQAAWEDGSGELPRGIYLRMNRTWAERLGDIIHEVKHAYTDSIEA
jgi:hypothetical protein